MRVDGGRNGGEKENGVKEELFDMNWGFFINQSYRGEMIIGKYERQDIIYDFQKSDSRNLY